MVNSWDKWGHNKSVAPEDWADVNEYIEAIAKWAEYRKKYPKAFEIIDGKGKSIYYKEAERRVGRPPKEVGNKPTGATPFVDGEVVYEMQPNGVEVVMIGEYLWPRSTIEAIQNGTYKDYNYRGGRTIWEIWEAHNSFSLT